MFIVSDINVFTQRLVHFYLGLLSGIQNCENNLLTIWGRLLNPADVLKINSLNIASARSRFSILKFEPQGLN